MTQSQGSPSLRSRPALGWCAVLLFAVGGSSCAGEPPVKDPNRVDEELEEQEEPAEEVESEILEPSPEGVWVPDPGQELPETFSEFRLYPELSNLNLVAAGAQTYEPRFPLWSNGSAKYRAVVTPSGVAPGPGDFPVGTYFFKTFSYDADNEQGERPVESRVMRLTTDGWEFHRYTWNAAGTEATLNTSPVQEYARVESDGEEFEHEIPNENDCKRCHDASDYPVLGYRELQLADEPLDAPDELTAAVMGYLVGNCNHCHNGLGTDSNSFDMAPEVFLDAVVGQMTEGSGSGSGIRVAPGDPEASLLFIALSGGDGDEIQPMPPIGVQRRDQEGIELFREWIAQLEE